MGNLVFLNRDAILSAVDVDTEDVEVVEWGGTVRVRSISAAERERLMKSSVIMEGKGKHATRRFDMPTFRVKLAAISMIDQDGKRLFSEDDVFVLGKKSAKALQRVADVAARLAGIDDEEESDDESDEVEMSAEGKDYSTTQPTD